MCHDVIRLAPIAAFLNRRTFIHTSRYLKEGKLTFFVTCWEDSCSGPVFIYKYQAIVTYIILDLKQPIFMFGRCLMMAYRKYRGTARMGDLRPVQDIRPHRGAADMVPQVGETDSGPKKPRLLSIIGSGALKEHFPAGSALMGLQKVSQSRFCWSLTVVSDSKWSNMQLIQDTGGLPSDLIVFRSLVHCSPGKFSIKVFSLVLFLVDLFFCLPSCLR